MRGVVATVFCFHRIFAVSYSFTVNFEIQFFLRASSGSTAIDFLRYVANFIATVWPLSRTNKQQMRLH